MLDSEYNVVAKSIKSEQGINNDNDHDHDHARDHHSEHIHSEKIMQMKDSTMILKRKH